MFSYEDYRNIITIIKESGRAATFEEAKNREDFIVMRHDVEFSVDRAYRLSQIEKEMNFTSTYFFQWTNNSYNILSYKNTDIIRKMHESGHKIGLHYAINGLTNLEEIKDKILLEVNVLSSMMGFEINSFSIHRPKNDILKTNLKIEGLLNAYGEHFFTYAEDVTEDSALAVKYVSDAQHHWNYGVPDRETLLGHKKVQILTHPYSWTEQGYDNLNNFRTMLEERQQELIHTIDHECKHFALIKEQL